MEFKVSLWDVLQCHKSYAKFPEKKVNRLWSCNG